MNLSASKNITFQEAIKLTQSFLENINSMDENQKEATVSSLVKTENGARGFFVTFLTNEEININNYSEGILNGLKSSPEIVAELLVKNVAMSTSMAITHRRNDNEELAEKSTQVKHRSKYIIKKLDLDVIREKIEQLKLTIEHKKGVYQEFLERWGYDHEQKQAILESINN